MSLEELLFEALDGFRKWGLLQVCISELAFYLDGCHAESDIVWHAQFFDLCIGLLPVEISRALEEDSLEIWLVCAWRDEHLSHALHDGEVISIEFRRLLCPLRIIGWEKGPTESCDDSHDFIDELVHDSLTSSLVHAIGQYLYGGGPDAPFLGSLLQTNTAHLLKVHLLSSAGLLEYQVLLCCLESWVKQEGGLAEPWPKLVSFSKEWLLLIIRHSEPINEKK